MDDSRHEQRSSTEEPPSHQGGSPTTSCIDNDQPNRLGDAFTAAIEARDSLSAKNILDHNKAAVISQPEFEWFEKLLDTGHSTAEIVDLLVEEKRQSPWIYYEPSGLWTPHPDIRLHRTACVHNKPPLHENKTLEIDVPETPQYQVIDRVIAEMCGLAGVIPFGGGPSTWDGEVEFTPDPYSESSLIATISYGASHHISDSESVSSVPGWVLREFESCYAALNRACRLFAWLQQHSLICERYTILTQDTIDAFALAVQTICIGLLGLSNAHLGKWHPFFLEHDLTEVRLRGADGTLSRTQDFSVRLTELSCIGEMLGSPVRVFTMGDATVSSRCDLLTSVADLLDLWGPGEVILDRNSRTGNDICLVRIGDGVLYKTSDKSRKTLHWARGSLPEEPHDQGCFDKNEKLLIGILAPLATLNSDCPFSHTSDPHRNLRRFHTNRMVHELGTWASYWDQRERQAGLQGGNYVLATFNLTWKKISSQRIKEKKLRGGQLDLQFLEAPWGLQVSACTGVAQRVPLREVVADAMVPMVEAWGNRPDEWTELLNTHAIVDQFRSPGFVVWFNGLNGPQRMAVAKISKHVLTQLSYTGFNDQGGLVLACPLQKDAFACIQIPCREGQLWTRVLKDTQECATFACITSRCLETPDHKCRNSPNAGSDQPILLVTAVCQYHQAQSGTWEKMTQQGLQNGNSYWMGEPGNEMKFKARLHTPSSPASAKILEICASQIPAKIRQRMIATWFLKPGRSIRLQERRKVNEEYAEDVFVSGDQLLLGKRLGPALKKKIEAMSGSGKEKESQKIEPLIS